MRNFKITIRNCVGSTLYTEEAQGKDANEALFKLLTQDRILLDDGDTIEIEEN